MICGKAGLRSIRQFNVLTRKAHPGKDFSFIKSQTRPSPSFPSVSAEHPASCRKAATAHQPRPDSAALRERRKPNQTTKKSALTQKSVLQAVPSSQGRAGELRRGQGNVWNELTQHRGHSSQQGRPPPARAATSLCLVPELLCGACAPRGPEQIRGTQGTKCMPRCGQALPGKRSQRALSCPSLLDVRLRLWAAHARLSERCAAPTCTAQQEETKGKGHVALSCLPVLVLRRAAPATEAGDTGDLSPGPWCCRLPWLLWPPSMSWPSAGSA